MGLSTWFGLCGLLEANLVPKMSGVSFGATHEGFQNSLWAVLQEGSELMQDHKSPTWKASHGQ